MNTTWYCPKCQIQQVRGPEVVKFQCDCGRWCEMVASKTFEGIGHKDAVQWVEQLVRDVRSGVNIK